MADASAQPNYQAPIPIPAETSADELSIPVPVLAVPEVTKEN